MPVAVFNMIKASERASPPFYIERSRPFKFERSSSEVRVGVRVDRRCVSNATRSLIRLHSPARKLRGLGMPAF